MHRKIFLVDYCVYPGQRGPLSSIAAIHHAVTLAHFTALTVNAVVSVAFGAVSPIGNRQPASNVPGTPPLPAHRPITRRIDHGNRVDTPAAILTHTHTSTGIRATWFCFTPDIGPTAFPVSLGQGLNAAGCFDNCRPSQSPALLP